MAALGKTKASRKEISLGTLQRPRTDEAIEAMGIQNTDAKNVQHGAAKISAGSQNGDCKDDGENIKQSKYSTPKRLRRSDGCVGESPSVSATAAEMQRLIFATMCGKFSS